MKQLLIKLLVQVIQLVTPELNRALCEMTDEFCKKAKKSANPWDDILCDLLTHIFGCVKK